MDGLPDDRWNDDMRSALYRRERWLTPDGDLIFGQGITPSEAVPMPIDQVPLDPTEVGHLDPSAVPTLADVQLRRAIEILE